MLVLTRRHGEEVVLGDDIRVQVVEIRGDRVRLGFTAPTKMAVHRKEVKDLIDAEIAQGKTLTQATIAAEAGQAKVMP